MIVKNILLNGALVGLFAVIAMTIVMNIAKKMKIMPEKFNMPLMLGSMIEKNDKNRAKKIGILMHLFNGIIFGVIFIYFKSYFIFETTLLQALVWSIILWLVMMFILMPIFGKGLFANKISPRIPILTLIAHLIFGVVLGLLI